MTSARILMEADAMPATHRGLLAVGGIDYGTGHGPGRADATVVPRDGSVAEDRFPPIPGTRDEALRAAHLFRQAYPDEAQSVDLWTGREPTERRLKRELADPSRRRWDHILLASHGIFSMPGWVSGGLESADWGLSDPSDRTQVVRLGGMYFSGIALAGANRPDDGGEDEILTADEVHGLDLSGSTLVALTGCETALGVPVSGEGLMGLRSALHAAGVRNVIASVWQIDDKVTRDLIEQFYINLWSGRMTPQDALRHAQVRLLRTGAGASPHPYYWAGFVLTGAPARPPAPLPGVFESKPEVDQHPGQAGRPPDQTHWQGYGIVVAGCAVAFTIWMLRVMRRRGLQLGR